jgi:hypothetical protein
MFLPSILIYFVSFLAVTAGASVIGSVDDLSIDSQVHRQPQIAVPKPKPYVRLVARIYVFMPVFNFTSCWCLHLFM